MADQFTTQYSNNKAVGFRGNQAGARNDAGFQAQADNETLNAFAQKMGFGGIAGAGKLSAFMKTPQGQQAFQQFKAQRSQQGQPGAPSMGGATQGGPRPAAPSGGIQTAPPQGGGAVSSTPIAAPRPTPSPSPAPAGDKVSRSGGGWGGAVRDILGNIGNQGPMPLSRLAPRNPAQVAPPPPVPQETPSQVAYAPPPQADQGSGNLGMNSNNPYIQNFNRGGFTGRGRV